MKTILLFLIFFSQTSFSGEFTGAGKDIGQIFANGGVNLRGLIGSGHKVLTGEFTGAGKVVETNRIKYLAARGEVFGPQNLLGFEYIYPSTSSNVSEVKLFKTQKKDIPLEEVQAIIYEAFQ